MTTVKISQLTAHTPAAADLVELSKLSTVIATGTTISAQASDNSFNATGMDFPALGFVVGRNVKVAGFTGNVLNNVFTATLTAVAVGKLTCGGTDGDVIVDDAAGETVTITQWESVRGTVAGIAALASSLAAVNVWTKNNSVTPVALTSGATIAIDASLSNNFKCTLAHNGTYSNPINATDGMVINLASTQDGTGGRIPAFGSAFKWGKGGTGGMPTASTAPGAVNFYSFYYHAATGFWYGAMLDSVATTPVLISIALSDETTAITTGVGKCTFRSPFAFTLTEIRLSANVAPTGSTILMDVKETGVTVLSTKVMINASAKTSVGAATPYVISDAAIADDAEVSFDFFQVGSTISGAGIKAHLIGYR